PADRLDEATGYRAGVADGAPYGRESLRRFVPLGPAFETSDRRRVPASRPGSETLDTSRSRFSRTAPRRNRAPPQAGRRLPCRSKRPTVRQDTSRAEDIRRLHNHGDRETL